MSSDGSSNRCLIRYTPSPKAWGADPFGHDSGRAPYNKGIEDKNNGTDISFIVDGVQIRNYSWDIKEMVVGDWELWQQMVPGFRLTAFPDEVLMLSEMEKLIAELQKFKVLADANQGVINGIS